MLSKLFIKYMLAIIKFNGLLHSRLIFLSNYPVYNVINYYLQLFSTNYNSKSNNEVKNKMHS